MSGELDSRFRALLSGIFCCGVGARQTNPEDSAIIELLRLGFWGSAVPYVASAFHRLLEPLDRRELARVVAAHRGDHGVGKGPKGWTCERHLKALLFTQFAGLTSLREIEQGLGAAPRALYHLNLRPAPKSTLADALALRPADVFKDICLGLIGRASRAVRREGRELIQLIDATPIPLRDPRFAWAEADARTRGLKLHLGYDPRGRMPCWAEVTSPKVSDIAVARDVSIEAGTLYVFDKAYVDFSWWHQIHEGKAWFVSRLKSNACRRDVVALSPVGENILADNEIRLGHAKPRGGAVNPLADTPLREIFVAREDKEPLRLVTNDLKRPAAEIADLYKERWQIELLFKWIKQNLKIKRFLGRSQNAVKSQIYIALIAFLLLRMFRQTYAKSHGKGPKVLIARLKVALFGRFDLTNREKPPPRHPRQLPPSPQMAFNLAI